jgi:hypothetical protein
MRWADLILLVSMSANFTWIISSCNYVCNEIKETICISMQCDICRVYCLCQQQTVCLCNVVSALFISFAAVRLPA